MGNFNVPINKWTIMAVLVAAASVGGDLWASILKAVAVMLMPHMPAV